MRKLLYTVLIAGLATLGACKNKKSSGDPTAAADSTQAAMESDTVADAAVVSERLRELIGEEGLLRGVNLGDNLATVRAKEKAELFEDSTNHLGYTVEYANLESADILYYKGRNGKVNRIGVDLYLNSRQSVDTFVQDLRTFFTGRYGAPRTSPRSWSWQTPSNEPVVLQDVSKGKDYGLKLTFGGTSNLQASLP